MKNILLLYVVVILIDNKQALPGTPTYLWILFYVVVSLWLLVSIVKAAIKLIKKKV